MAVTFIAADKLMGIISISFSEPCVTHLVVIRQHFQAAIEHQLEYSPGGCSWVLNSKSYIVHTSGLPGAYKKS